MQTPTLIMLVLVIGVRSAPLPPREVNAYDYPDDRGGRIIVSWERSLTDSVSNYNNVWGYRVFRINIESNETLFLGFVDRWQSLLFVDSTAVDGKIYQYLVQTKSTLGTSDYSVSNITKSKSSYIYFGRINVLIFLIFTIIVFFIYRRKIMKGLIRNIYSDRTDWSIEKGKPVMIIINFKEVIQGIFLNRIINDLKWLVQRIIRADGEIRILVPGYILKTVYCVVREVFMKEEKLHRLNPLSLRRIWSSGSSFSEEACRLVHYWKPGVLIIIGEPGQWVFPAVNAAIDESSEIIGWNVSKRLFSAALLSEIDLKNITGDLSHIFFPDIILRKLISVFIVIVSLSILVIFFTWIFFGSGNVQFFDSLRDGIIYFLK